MDRKTINLADPCMVVHNGALGDFLLAWPALLSLARARAGSRLYWAGRDSHASWARGAGWLPASMEIKASLNDLYKGRWPESLEQGEIVWFGLKAATLGTHFSDVILHDKRLWMIAAIPEEHEYGSPREKVRLALAQRGVPWAHDWRKAWLEFCAPEYNSSLTGGVLLFPGAGHRAKQWSLVNYFELGWELRRNGLCPAFVLGPAELDREVDAQLRSCGDLPGEIVASETLERLNALIAGAGLVIGNDSGPMHLASMYGKPGVVLFGPTSRRQWAAEGLVCLASEVICRPCTETTADISCQEPWCMDAISVGQVMHSVIELLADSGP